MTQASESCRDLQRVLRLSNDALTPSVVRASHCRSLVSFRIHSECNSFNRKFQVHCVLNQKSDSHVAEGINLCSQSVSGRYLHNGDFRSECLYPFQVMWNEAAKA